MKIFFFTPGSLIKVQYIVNRCLTFFHPFKRNYLYIQYCMSAQSRVDFDFFSSFQKKLFVYIVCLSQSRVQLVSTKSGSALYQLVYCVQCTVEADLSSVSTVTVEFSCIVLIDSAMCRYFLRIQNEIICILALNSRD